MADTLAVVPDGSITLLCDSDAIAQHQLDSRRLAALLDAARAEMASAAGIEFLGELAGIDQPPFDAPAFPLPINPEDRAPAPVALFDDLALVHVQDFYDSILGWGCERLTGEVRAYLEAFASGVLKTAPNATVGYLQYWDGNGYPDDPRLTRREYRSLQEWLDAPVIPYCLTVLKATAR